MTVASLAIASFGAASNGFWMGSVVWVRRASMTCACAGALIATAITPSTNIEIGFMGSPPIAMPQNLGVKPAAAYHDGAYSALSNSSADGQAARYALGNRPVERA